LSLSSGLYSSHSNWLQWLPINGAAS
jgi:hypothetical protein